MATKEELEQRLAEAEAARHQVAIGKKTVTLSYEGRSVTYTQATLAQLDKYIEDLTIKINGRRSRSRKVYF